jgi:hypothetical protein
MNRFIARRLSAYRRATRDTSEDLGWFATGFVAVLPGDQHAVSPAATSDPRKHAQPGWGSRRYRPRSVSKRQYDYRASASSPRGRRELKLLLPWVERGKFRPASPGSRLDGQVTADSQICPLTLLASPSWTC